MLRFKDFIKEGSDVIDQLRKVRDDMKILRLRRELEKQKHALESMKKENKRTFNTKYR
jgi:hypothetical protein